MNVYSIFYWNVGLSPSALDVPEDKDPSDFTSKEIKNIQNKKKNFDLKKLYVEKILNWILIEKKIDLVFFSEVSDQDIDFFNNFIKSLGVAYSVINGAIRTDTTRFDNCCIYKTTSFFSTLDIPEVYLTSSGKHSFNVASKYQFIPHTYIEDNKLKIEDSSRLIDFYVCHWPSKLATSGEEKRYLISNTLFYELRDNLQRNFMVLGDFNANPYEDVIYKNLNGIRCKQTVLRHGIDDADLMYLYNPSWKFLWANNDHIDNSIDVTDNGEKLIGTHYYAKNSSERWHVFDQLLLPYTLINQEKQWNFESQSLTMLNIDLISSKTWRKAKFDHLPFIFEISEI